MTTGTTTRRRHHHGLSLFPPPSSDPRDPLRWSRSLKYAAFAAVALANFTANVCGAGPSVATMIFQQEFEVSAVRANDLLSVSGSVATREDGGETTQGLTYFANFSLCPRRTLFNSTVFCQPSSPNLFSSCWTPSLTPALFFSFYSCPSPLFSRWGSSTFSSSASVKSSGSRSPSNGANDRP